MTEIRLELEFGFSLVAVITRYKKEIPADQLTTSMRVFEDGYAAELDYKLYVEFPLWKRVVVDEKQDCISDEKIYNEILEELQDGDYDEV